MANRAQITRGAHARLTCKADAQTRVPSLDGRVSRAGGASVCSPTLPVADAKKACVPPYAGDVAAFVVQLLTRYPKYA